MSLAKRTFCTRLSCLLHSMLQASCSLWFIQVFDRWASLCLRLWQWTHPRAVLQRVLWLQQLGDVGGQQSHSIWEFSGSDIWYVRAVLERLCAGLCVYLYIHNRSTLSILTVSYCSVFLRFSGTKGNQKGVMRKLVHSSMQVRSSCSWNSGWLADGWGHGRAAHHFYPRCSFWVGRFCLWNWNVIKHHSVCRCM